MQFGRNPIPIAVRFNNMSNASLSQQKKKTFPAGGKMRNDIVVERDREKDVAC